MPSPFIIITIVIHPKYNKQKTFWRNKALFQTNQTGPISR